MSGCAGWEWSFEMNSLGMTETVIKKLGSYISGNTIVNPGGGVGVGISTGGPRVGSGGSGSGSGGGGGGAGAPGSSGGPGPGDASEEPAVVEAPAPTRAGEGSVVTVAGRVWGVIASGWSVQGDAVALEATLEARGEGVKGVYGALRVLVPRSEWPDASEGSADEAAWPATVVQDGAAARGKEAPTLPLGWDGARVGLELAGVKYEGSFHDARLRVDERATGGATVEGTIDMLVRREGAGETQWVRIRAVGASREVARGR